MLLRISERFEADASPHHRPRLNLRRQLTATLLPSTMMERRLRLLRGRIPVGKYRRAPAGVRDVEIARTAQSGAKPAFTFAGRALGSLADLATDWQDFPQMNINNDVVEAIGNTPLIKLKRASEQTGCTILGKAEFMNPGQSVKDRAGKWMILEAEKRGE